MKAIFIISLISLIIVCVKLEDTEKMDAMKAYGDQRTCNNYKISTEKGKEVRAYSEDFCRSLYSSEFRCCYVHAKYDGNTYRGCYPFTYANYANASEIEPGDLDGLNSDFTDLSIHCNSKYLTITASFIALVVALF